MPRCSTVLPPARAHGVPNGLRRCLQSLVCGNKRPRETTPLWRGCRETRSRGALIFTGGLCPSGTRSGSSYSTTSIIVGNFQCTYASQGPGCHPSTDPQRMSHGPLSGNADHPLIDRRLETGIRTYRWLFFERRKPIARSRLRVSPSEPGTDRVPNTSDDDYADSSCSSRRSEVSVHRKAIATLMQPTKMPAMMSASQ